MRNNPARYWVDQAASLVAFHFRRRRLHPDHVAQARKAIQLTRDRAHSDKVEGYRD